MMMVIMDEWVGMRKGKLPGHVTSRSRFSCYIRKDTTKNHIFRTSNERNFTLNALCYVWVWSASVSSGVFLLFRNEGGGFLRA
jgi:hypothetical protein